MPLAVVSAIALAHALLLTVVITPTFVLKPISQVLVAKALLSLLLALFNAQELISATHTLVTKPLMEGLVDVPRLFSLLSQTPLVLVILVIPLLETLFTLTYAPAKLPASLTLTALEKLLATL
jgi:hypothetical protein